MNKKKKTVTMVCILLVNILIVLATHMLFFRNITLSIRTASQNNDELQLFYSEQNEFSELNSFWDKEFTSGITKVTEVDVPLNTQFIRIDFAERESEVIIDSFSANKLFSNVNLFDLIKNNNVLHNCELVDNGSSFTVIAHKNDPYIIIDSGSLITGELKNSISLLWGLTTGLICIVCSFILYFTLVHKVKGEKFNLIRELKDNRKLIWSLAKNDFKTKYAGSYFGIFWAFVQPIVTILIYVFVFQVGFKAAPEGDYPYVLWLIAGIIPWFFFVEGLVNATNCLVEYSYLVKKVVFKISVLPLVKIISSLFVHLFFIVFAIFIYYINGKMPGLAIMQVLYYCICAIALVLSLSYLTSSIVPFFKDFSQIISILTQIGMWMLPIMWNKNMLEPQFQWILKLNPMYYVVEGYRESFIYGTWFWEKPTQTIYFWGCVILIYLISITVFKKLKIHFSDVL